MTYQEEERAMILSATTGPTAGAPVRGLKRNPEGWQNTIPKKFHNFLDVFEDITPDTKPVSIPGFDCDITLKDGEVLTSSKIYAMSRDELEVLDRILENELAMGIIRSSKAEASAPVFFVYDPASEGRNDGKRQMRLVKDYRQLNTKIKRNDYPIPLTRPAIQHLSRAKFIASFDAKSGFDLVPMEPSAIHLTAFKTPRGQFESLRMPMGLATAPAIFQRRLNHVLQGMIGQTCYVYLDDIIIFADTQEDFDAAIREMLGRLRKAGFKLSPKKSFWDGPEFNFLGYTIVKGKGVRMSHDKVELIKASAPPRNVAEVRKLMGLINFYAHFIPHFADKAACITDLTKKDEPWDWNEPRQAAWLELIKGIREDIFLIGFDPDKPIRLETDASDVAHGGVIKQPRVDDPSKWGLVYCFHHKFTAGEVGWGGPDKELFAIVHAFREFRDILAAPRFTVQVYSDHRNLAKFMFGSHDLRSHDGRLGRWWEELSGYDFTIEYRPGIENVEADFMSRYGFEDSAALESQVLLPLHRFSPKALDDILGWFRQKISEKNIREKLETSFSRADKAIKTVIAEISSKLQQTPLDQARSEKLNDSADPVPHQADASAFPITAKLRQRTRSAPGADLDKILPTPENTRMAGDRRGLGMPTLSDEMEWD
jgi:hypothetical protein